MENYLKQVNKVNKIEDNLISELIDMKYLCNCEYTYKYDIDYILSQEFYDLKKVMEKCIKIENVLHKEKGVLKELTKRIENE